MTQMLSSNFMCLIDLVSTFSGRKMVTMTVFTPSNYAAGISKVVSTGKVGAA